MILEAIGRAVTKAPAMFVIAILLLTVFFGYFAGMTTMEAEDEDFNPDTEIALASERINDYFGPGVRSVQVIVRDPNGDSGDVLTQQALLEHLDLQERILEPIDEKLNITDTLQGTDTIPTGIQSIADIIAFGAMLQGTSVTFVIGMQGITAVLGDTDANLSQAIGSLSSMNLSNNESVGSTLSILNMSMDGEVARIMGLLSSVGGMLGPVNGNGAMTAIPTVSVIRESILNMTDTDIKATVSGFYTFDKAPLEGAVLDVVTKRTSVVTNANTSTTGPIGGQLLGLLANPAFLAGNYTFDGEPVDAVSLINDILTNLGTLEAMVGGLSGFEATPQVLEAQLGGLGIGLRMVMSKDFDPNATLPRAKASLMIVQQNGTIDSDDILEAQYDLEEIADNLEKESSDGVEYMIMGGEILFDKINTSSMGSLGTLMGLAVVFIVVILYLVYRSFWDTFFTLIALMFVIVWTFGFGVLLGYTFNPLTTAVPILLVGLSVDYGIHLTMRNRLEKRTKSLTDSAIATIASVGMALLLATVTTVFSFMSNIISSLMVMRQFGTLTAMGIISAFVVMNTFVPACRILLDRRRERKGLRRGSSKGGSKVERRDNALVRFVQLGAHGASKYSTAIVGIAVVLSLLSFASITAIDSEFDFMDFLPDDLPETQTITFLLNEFNFSSSSSTVLIEGNVATTQVMEAIHQAQEDMADDRDVVIVGDRADVRSPLTVIHRFSLESSPSYIPELGEAFRASDTDGDGIPDEDVGELLELLATYPASARDMAGVLHRIDNETFDAAIISVGVFDATDGGEKLSDELNGDIESLARLDERGSLDMVIVTNGPVLTYNVVSEMNEAGLKSVVATIIAAAILLTITYFVAYRAPIVGILTTIPIVLVIGWVFGSMFLLGIPLNVITITIAALTVGLGITYAIHISHRFLEDIEKEPWEEAMCTTVGHTGAALFGAAATTVGGFGILAFSILPPMAQFGIVTALSIAFSFLASVFVLPSFLAIWARWKLGESPDAEMCATDEAPPAEETAPSGQD
jgi:predicted RND superfamily exporter protein